MFTKVFVSGIYEMIPNPVRNSVLLILFKCSQRCKHLPFTHFRLILAPRYDTSSTFHYVSCHPSGLVSCEYIFFVILKLLNVYSLLSQLFLLKLSLSIFNLKKCPMGYLIDCRKKNMNHERHFCFWSRLSFASCSLYVDFTDHEPKTRLFCLWSIKMPVTLDFCLHMFKYIPNHRPSKHHTLYMQ